MIPARGTVCAGCNGTGKKNGKTCPWCGGDGTPQGADYLLVDRYGENYHRECGGQGCRQCDLGHVRPEREAP